MMEKKNEQDLLNSLSPEIKEEVIPILKGEKGLMPILSNKIEIVWVNPWGLGRKAILEVDNEGREEFERVNDFLRKRFKENK